MAAQTMINTGCSAVAYIDNATAGVPFDIYYYDTGGNNPALYTVADEWDDTGGDFFGDVEAMCADLAERGLPVTDLVVGTAVGQFIMSNEKVDKILDNRRMEFGRLAPKSEYLSILARSLELRWV